MVRQGAVLISTSKSFQRRGPINALVWNVELKEGSGRKILGFSRGYTDAAIQINNRVLDCAEI